MKGRHPKVLIVGTIPYNKNTSSRAFDAYFHNWEKKNLRQVFSNTKVPVKGHCSSLYQITDQRLLKRHFNRKEKVGVIFRDEELPTEWTDSNLEVGNKFVEWLYRFGSKESALKHLGRKWLWKKKYWDTPHFREWLDDFQPECVFLAFSDDFFILEIALFVADRYNIPIVSCIGDDYYFNDRANASPIYHLYRKKYKSLVRSVFAKKGSAIYISDKIRDKYNQEFDINGETIYLASEIERRAFREIDKETLVVSYCGNIRLGRNRSLIDIANSLQEINPNYYLDVYSAEKNREYIAPLIDCKGIRYHGAIPYNEVVEVMKGSDISIVVEGFKKKEIDTVKYSLSTKAADSLAAGGQIFAYGAKECGVIEYLESINAAVVCTNKNELKSSLNNLIEDKYIQANLYKQAQCVFQKNHNKADNLRKAEKIFIDLVEENLKDAKQ